MSQRSKSAGWLRLLSVYVLVAALLIASRPAPCGLAAGSLIAFGGEALRLWAAGHLVKSSRLITAGPYAYTQHPLYLGRLLILTGLGIAARCPLYLNLLVLLGAYSIFFLYYMPRKRRVEGTRLATRHGSAFEVYRRAVPVLFPRRRRYPGAAGDAWSFALVAKSGEPMVLLGVLLVFGVLAWKCAAR